MRPEVPDRLYHVSDQSGIRLFEPRPPQPLNPNNQGRPVVWAIAERLLHNYLLPRDCPRVTFYARSDSEPEDIARLMGITAARYVVAIESVWLTAVREATLFLYEFSPEGFTVVDEGAGYYARDSAVAPLAVCEVNDLLGELVTRDVELRVTPSLWLLHDAVLASSLQYSFIRMRNAQPRSNAI